jgi:hypothetical protein
MRRIEDAAGLNNTTDEPSQKPHGRLVWTLMFPAFADPRFVDLGIISPRRLASGGGASDAMREAVERVKFRLHFDGWPAESFWNAGTEESPRWIPDWRYEIALIEHALHGTPITQPEKPTDTKPRNEIPDLGWGARVGQEAEVLAPIMAELERATRKFPTWPTDPLHAVAVLGEEYGELDKAVLQAVYEPHKSTTEDVRSEAIQTAAMAIRFVASLDHYEYACCPLHEQPALAAGPTPETPR